MPHSHHQDDYPAPVPMTSPHAALRVAQRARTSRRDPGHPQPMFAREADMIGPILDAVDEFTHGLPDATAHTFLEVALAGGVPDVVIVAFDADAVRYRLAHGLGPVTSLTSMRALDGLSAGVMEIGALATHTGLSRAHLRRTVLPALAAAGWVDALHGRSTRIDVRHAHEQLTQWVVTIEAKRSAWAAAVAQARRHLLAADRAFIALDARSARRALTTAPALARQGVGVAMVAAGTPTVGFGPIGLAGVVSYPDVRRPGLPPSARAPRSVDRRLVAERVWDMRLRGVTKGRTHPVFGRDLTA